MKKSLFVLLFSTLLVVSCSSNDNQVIHRHAYEVSWTYNNDQHWHAATCGHNVKGSLDDHHFGDWTIDVAPTETTNGHQYRICKVCKYMQEETLPPTGEGGGETHTHTFESGWSFNSEEHWHAANCGHNVRADVATHSYPDNWIIDYPATETEKGQKHKECLYCQYTIYEEIPPTGGGEEEEEEEDTPIEPRSIQDVTILHAWDWKLNDIKSRLKRISEAGYKAIQISPMQPHVDGASGAQGKTQNNWWKLYQPLAFKVATGNENILGTKDDLTSLCSTAKTYGIDIIVDIVSNHLAGTNTSYSSQVYKRYPLHSITQKADDNSAQLVVQGHIGLPDLDTSNSEVQNDVLSMMKEYIDCGVTGFRFDAAKHIETPDDGEYASNYWPFVLDGTTNYALSKGLKKPYYYGEILNTCGNGRRFSWYTKMMSIVDSKQGWSTLKSSVSNLISTLPLTYDTNENPDHLVLWAESHDNYANYDNTTRDYQTELVNKAYVIQTSRKDAASLYYARPNSMDVNMCLVDDLGGWQYPEVVAINKFHNRYIDKAENKYTYDNYFVNERGEGVFAGAVFVDLNRNKTATKEFTVEVIKDGKYIDLVSKKEFVVIGHKVTVSFTNDVCILIPKDAYKEDEPTSTYVGSVTITNAPSEYTYIAWVWGSGTTSTWMIMQKDNDGIGLCLPNNVSFLIAVFTKGTTPYSANWSGVIKQTNNMSYSNIKQIHTYESLSWKTSS